MTPEQTHFAGILIVIITVMLAGLEVFGSRLFGVSIVAIGTFATAWLSHEKGFIVAAAVAALLMIAVVTKHRKTFWR